MWSCWMLQVFTENLGHSATRCHCWCVATGTHGYGSRACHTSLQDFAESKRMRNIKRWKIWRATRLALKKAEGKGPIWREGGGKEEEIKLKSLEGRKARGMQIEAEPIMRECSGSVCWCWVTKIWMNKEREEWVWSESRGLIGGD